MQVHNAMAMVQHSTHGVHLLWTAARNAHVSHGATGSCGITSALVLKQALGMYSSFLAGRDSMYDWVMDAATYVRVQSIFFEVTVVFPCKAAGTAVSFGGSRGH